MPAISGYGMCLLSSVSVCLATIWGLFILMLQSSTEDAWRFKLFIVFYIVFLLTISASLFSIKTGALLWFLYGTLNNKKGNRSGGRFRNARRNQYRSCLNLTASIGVSSGELSTNTLVCHNQTERCGPADQARLPKSRRNHDAAIEGPVRAALPDEGYGRTVSHSYRHRVGN